jgi:hypothetical protein
VLFSAKESGDASALRSSMSQRKLKFGRVRARHAPIALLKILTHGMYRRRMKIGMRHSPVADRRWVKTTTPASHDGSPKALGRNLPQRRSRRQRHLRKIAKTRWDCTTHLPRTQQLRPLLQCPEAAKEAQWSTNTPNFKTSRTSRHF